MLPLNLRYIPIINHYYYNKNKIYYCSFQQIQLMLFSVVMAQYLRKFNISIWCEVQYKLLFGTLFCAWFSFQTVGGYNGS